MLSLERRDKVRSDFVVRLPDHRAHGCNDPVARGTEPLHGHDRRLDDTCERAAPAGMRCSDDARLRVGKQDRSAVRC
jgi:hypothetical protein